MTMEREEKLRRNIANNLIHYRKESNLTQLELAEKLQYSDKAISKWERGESVPDIFILHTLADLYSCSVDDFLSERIKVKRSFYKNRFINYYFICNPDAIDKDVEEKVGKIYVLQGNKPIEVPELHAGDIGALAKVTAARTGNTLSTKANVIQYGKAEI